MTFISLAGWLARELISRPITWCALATGALSWPLLAWFTPIALTSSRSLPAGLLYELAFMGALLGALAALVRLEELGWLLARPAPLRRALVQLALVTLGGAVGSTAGLMVPLLAGLVPTALLAPLLHHVLATSAHLGALGLWLLLPGLPTRHRALALPVLAWLLPALLQGGGRLAEAGAHLLAVSTEPALVSAGAAAELGARAGPIVALALGAVLAERGLTGLRPRSGS